MLYKNIKTHHTPLVLIKTLIIRLNNNTKKTNLNQYNTDLGFICGTFVI